MGFVGHFRGIRQTANNALHLTAIPLRSIAASDPCNREEYWTESIAVGSSAFVEETKKELGWPLEGRETEEKDGMYILKETRKPYNPHFAHKKGSLRAENTYFWAVNDVNSRG